MREPGGRVRSNVMGRWLVGAPIALPLVLLGAAGASAAPSVGSLAPATVRAGSASQTLVVDGAGFTASSRVLWNGAERTTTLVGPTRLTAALTAADLAQAGSAEVAVRDGADTTPALALPIVSRRPGVAEIQPATVVRGAPSLRVTVKGYGFGRGSRVQVDGAQRTTSFVNSRTLTVDLFPGELSTRRTVGISVANPQPAPDGAVSGTLPLAVTEPVPSIASVTPTPVAAGSDATVLTLTGQNFAAGAVADWGVCPTAAPLACVTGSGGDVLTPTTMTVTVPAPALAGAGLGWVSVRSAAGPPEVSATVPWAVGAAANTTPGTPAGVQLFTRTAGGASQRVTGPPTVWPGTVLTGRATVADAQGGPLAIEVNWRYADGAFTDHGVLTTRVGGPGVHDFALPDVADGPVVARVRVRDAAGAVSDWRSILSADPDWTVTPGLPPTVTAITPAELAQGATARGITVSGQGFLPGAQIQVNGVARTTTFVNATTVRTTLGAADVATPSRLTVVVGNRTFNAPVGAELSNPTPLLVRGDQPLQVGPPAGVVPPSLTGSPQAGQSLRCLTGTWLNAPTAFAIDWLRNGAPIIGAIGETYTPGATDVGQAITCRVVASNAGGDAFAVSGPLVVMAAPAPAAAQAAVPPAAQGTGAPAAAPATTALRPRRAALLGPLSVRAGRNAVLALRFDRPAARLRVTVEIRRGGRVRGTVTRTVSGLAPVLRIRLATPGRTVLRVTWREGGGARSSASTVVLVRR